METEEKTLSAPLLSLLEGQTTHCHPNYRNVFTLLYIPYTLEWKVAALGFREMGQRPAVSFASLPFKTRITGHARQAGTGLTCGLQIHIS